MEYDLLCFRGYTATDTCVRIGAVLHVRAHWRPRHLRAHWRPPTCACALAPTYMLRAHWRPHGSCRSCLHVCVRVGAPHGSCHSCYMCACALAPHMVPAAPAYMCACALAPHINLCTWFLPPVSPPVSHVQQQYSFLMLMLLFVLV